MSTEHCPPWEVKRPSSAWVLQFCTEVQTSQAKPGSTRARFCTGQLSARNHAQQTRLTRGLTAVLVLRCSCIWGFTCEAASPQVGVAGSMGWLPVLEKEVSRGRCCPKHKSQPLLCYSASISLAKSRPEAKLEVQGLGRATSHMTESGDTGRSKEWGKSATFLECFNRSWVTTALQFYSGPGREVYLFPL